jgi:fatty acid desaturase
MPGFEMRIPTGAVIPPLLLAFGLLAFEHYRGNPDKPVRDPRFLMMVATVLMMAAQLIFGGSSLWVSPVLLALAMILLAVAGTLVGRRFRKR